MLPLCVLHVSVEQGIVRLTIGGEIDLGCVDALRSEVARHLGRSGVAALVIDLTAVRFIDCAAIGCLIGCRHAADKAAVPYRVTGAAGGVRDVLELLGVYAYLGADNALSAVFA